MSPDRGLPDAPTLPFFHPDFNGRPRNHTGSAISGAVGGARLGLAGCTAGGDLRPAPKEKSGAEHTARALKRQK